MLGYSDAKSFVEVAGAEPPRARCCSTRWSIRRIAQQKELQEWWLKKYGPPFPTFAFSVWDTPFILAMGMRKAQSVDPVKIAEALRGATWTGLYGARGVRHEVGLRHRIHDHARDIPIAVIKGGKPMQLAVVTWPPGV